MPSAFLDFFAFEFEFEKAWATIEADVLGYA